MKMCQSLVFFFGGRGRDEGVLEVLHLTVGWIEFIRVVSRMIELCRRCAKKVRMRPHP